jgi:hypothetical protein
MEIPCSALPFAEMEDSSLLWMQHEWEYGSTTMTDWSYNDCPSGSAAASGSSDDSCHGDLGALPVADEELAVRSTLQKWQKEEDYTHFLEDTNRVEDDDTADIPKTEDEQASRLVSLRWIHDLSSEELLQRLQKRCRPDDIPALPTKRKRRLTCSFLQRGRMDCEPLKQEQQRQQQCKDEPIECHDFVPPSPSLWTWNESATTTVPAIPWEDLLIPLWNHETATTTTSNGQENTDDLLLEWISVPPPTGDNRTEDVASLFHPHPKTEGTLRNGGNGKAKFVEDE